jgi:hypothetical protein
MPLYTFPLDFDCVNINTVSNTFCLPIRTECNPIDPDLPDNWFNDPGDEWNNSLCQADECYFVPYAEGDKVQFQTRYPDSGRDNPTDYDVLIGVRIVGSNGVVIDQVNNDALRKISAWDGNRNYQIIEFDLNDFDQYGCFSFEFESNGRVVRTNEYRKVNSCRGTFTIKSEWNKEDCFTFYYGSPEAYVGDLFNYNNTMRYYGSIKQDGDQIQKERIGRKVTSGQTINNYLIILGKQIPPFVKNIMINQHLAGEAVAIDSREYIFDDVLIEPIDTKNNMFHFTVRPQRICRINYNC